MFIRICLTPSEKSGNTVAIRLVQELADRHNVAAKDIWKQLPGICVARAIKNADDEDWVAAQSQFQHVTQSSDDPDFDSAAMQLLRDCKIDQHHSGYDHLIATARLLHASAYAD